MCGLLPPIVDRHVGSLPNSDLLKGLNGENKVVVGRVAVPPAVRREPIVRGAEVGGRDDDGRPRNAPAEVVHAPQLEASPADLAPLEQRLAQSHRRHSISTLDQVSVPARAPHRVSWVRRRVVSCSPRSPL